MNLEKLGVLCVSVVKNYGPRVLRAALKQAFRDRIAAVNAEPAMRRHHPAAGRTFLLRVLVRAAVPQVNRAHRLHQVVIGVTVLLFHKGPERLRNHERPVNVVLQRIRLGFGRLGRFQGFRHIIFRLPFGGGQAHTRQTGIKHISINYHFCEQSQCGARPAF